MMHRLTTRRAVGPLASGLRQLRFKRNITIRDALNQAMKQELERDERVFVMGEEVAQYQGAYKVTKGFDEKFNKKDHNREGDRVYGPQRVLDTPITEMGFAGIGVGAALAGLRPVVEFMTWNFAMQAIDQIVNSAAKALYMSGGQMTCPIVFRGPNGPSAGVGAQHSQCFAAWYASVPGLKVVAPYDAEDAIGLMKASIRDDNPVVFLESEVTYGESYEISDKVEEVDFVLPIGQAKIQREGKDISIPAFGKMVGMSLKAAEELKEEGIDVEVINLRSLRPLDRDTIVKSVLKTGKLLAVENGWPTCGIASEIIASVSESEAFYYLDAPMERLTGADIPMPYALPLEEASTPQIEDIKRAIRRVVGRASTN